MGSGYERSPDYGFPGPPRWRDRALTVAIFLAVGALLARCSGFV
jgi:hypothetical protein